MKCSLCEDCGWVCETHPGRLWEGDHACTCGGAGAPCPWCNLPDKDGAPRLPDGFRTEFEKKGCAIDRNPALCLHRAGPLPAGSYASENGAWPQCMRQLTRT
jgi:hypothetical protein